MFTISNFSFELFHLGDAAVVANELGRKCMLVCNTREEGRIRGLITTQQDELDPAEDDYADLENDDVYDFYDN